jgi:hypothetical protein
MKNSKYFYTIYINGEPVKFSERVDKFDKDKMVTLADSIFNSNTIAPIETVSVKEFTVVLPEAEGTEVFYLER